MAWVATAIIGSAVVGGAVTAYTSNRASRVQNEAAREGAAINREGQQFSRDVYDQTRADLTPFRIAGQEALPELQRLEMSQEMLDLRNPIKLDQATLESLPGYQFAKREGLKATQNSAAARGLGVSGAALKGAAKFATGLADQTFTNQMNLEQQNRQNAFSRHQTTYGNSYEKLKTLVTTGQNAAVQSGTAGSTAANTSGILGNNAAGNIIGGSNATAAGINATGGAISGMARDVGGYAMYRGLYGNSTAGPGTSGPYTPNYQGHGDTYGPGF